MKHSVAKYLNEFLISIDQIFSYTTTVESLDRYLENDLLKDAVARRLCIIGEALYQADKQNKELAIVEKSRIIGLRPILVHDYDSLNDTLLWSIVQTKLGVLKEETKKILNDQGSL